MKFQEFQKFPRITNLPIHEQIRIFNTHITYGQSSGRLLSPQNSPLVFACDGLGYASFTVNLFGGGVRQFSTTTGYVSVRNAANEVVTTYGDGVTDPILTDSLGAGSYCVWSSDSLGEPSGVMLLFWSDYTFDAFNIEGLTSVYYLRLSLNGTVLGTIDLTANVGLTIVEILQCEGIDSVLLPPTNLIEWFECGTSLITNTDDIINHFNPLIAGGGFANFGAGCAPRTPASDIIYNACIANFWTILGV